MIWQVPVITLPSASVIDTALPTALPTPAANASGGGPRPKKSPANRAFLIYLGNLAYFFFCLAMIKSLISSYTSCGMIFLFTRSSLPL